ncbi:hypothetical protein AAG570_006499 [Ranatra chinensis]|uniref:Uncharacterized protein n=1 Tax=Ranatra chinensis TaxID=642074 RepID=A0ABD0YU83_9HEMI
MVLAFIFLCAFADLSAASTVRKSSKLVVVSFDGFRYDFLDRGLTPNLNSLRQLGTYSRFMINVFPTQTFPNHFSIATGLYTEVHGVLANHVYDKTTKTLMNYGYPLFHYNKDVTPIWTLNEKAGGGRHSGVMMWAGSDFEYGGVNATFTKSYKKSVDWRERVDTVIGWLGHPETPANLVMMYFEQPDAEEHVYGPESPSGQTNNQIKRVDAITKYLVDSLRNSGLLDVNLVFISDHGMDGVQKKDIIDLTKIVGNLADMYGTSPVLQVYPKPGTNVENVFQILNKAANSMKTFKIYKKDTIPEHFHYKKCERAPPILAVAEPKYAFQDLYKMIEIYKKEYNISDTGFFGVHGYDPSYINMHPFFVADGPIFKNNYTVKGKMENIDMYLLFMHVLNLEMPFVKPNGTFNRVSEIFVSDKLPTTFITGIVN